MSEAEGALGQALEGDDDWETVEKPSKANRRLAPQKPFTKQDFVEKKSEAAPKPQGECVMRVAVCTA